MLKVKEWIEIFKELPQDAVVIVSSDSEGNSFSPLSNGIDWSSYWVPKNEELVDEEEAKEYKKKEIHKAVVLFPEH